MSRIFILVACVLGFLSVGLGAFAAHGLETRLSIEMLEVYQTGVQYQMFHVTALLMVAFLYNPNKPGFSLLKLSGYCFIVGVVLFSGSLYLLSISGITQLGIITPIGGVAFLLGWVFLFCGAYKQVGEKRD